MSGQCLARMDWQNGSISQNQRCVKPAQARPRSHIPAPLNRLPTVSITLLQWTFRTFCVEARGPQDEEGFASPAAEFHIQGFTPGNELVAVRAPYFRQISLVHGLKMLRHHENPLILPLSRQRRHNRRKLCMRGKPHVGPWCGVCPPRRWGSCFSPASVTPLLCRETPGSARKRRAPCGEFYASPRLLFLLSTSLSSALSALFLPLQCRI